MTTLRHHIEGNEMFVETTPAEFVEFLKNFDMPEAHSINNYDTGFVEASWKEMLDMAERGWEDGVKEIEARIEKVAISTGTGVGFDIERGLSGDFFDVGLVLTGEPECWLSVTQTETPKEEVHLIVNNTYSGAINQNTVYNRGAVIVNMIDRLRREYFVKLTIVDRSTALYGYCRGDLRFDMMTISCEIDTQNHYSRSYIAWMLASSSCLRRAYFAVLEHFAENNNCDGYGRPADLPDDKTEGTVYFPSIKSNQPFDTIEHAIETVETIVDEQFNKPVNA